MSDVYPKGQHPHWCDLGDDCRGDDPTHIGRSSRMFSQSAESRLKIELSRLDEDVVAAGTNRGPTQIRLTLADPFTAGSVYAVLTPEEAHIASMLLAQHVEYARREDQHPMHFAADTIRAEGSM